MALYLLVLSEGQVLVRAANGHRAAEIVVEQMGPFPIAAVLRVREDGPEGIVGGEPPETEPSRPRPTGRDPIEVTDLSDRGTRRFLDPGTGAVTTEPKGEPFTEEGT